MSTKLNGQYPFRFPLSYRRPPSLVVLLCLAAAVVAPHQAALAQDGTFLVFFDEAELPREPAPADELAERFAEALEVSYEGEEPMEGALVGGWVRDGEFVEWYRVSPSFQVKPGERVAVTDPDRMAGLFGRPFPNEYFGAEDDGQLFAKQIVFLPDAVFSEEGQIVLDPDSTDEVAALEAALYIAAVPVEEDLRERVTSRPMLVIFDAGR